MTKEQPRPDLSGAYGDREETLSWPGLFLVILYSLTVGWVCALAHSFWLWAASLEWLTDWRQPREIPRRNLRHSH